MLKIMKAIKPILRPIHRCGVRMRSNILGAPIRPSKVFYTYTRRLAVSPVVPPHIRCCEDAYAQELQEKGFVTIPDLYDPNLIQEIHEQFVPLIENEQFIQRFKYSRTIRAEVDLKQYMPKIFSFAQNERLKKVLHSFYKSYFKLFSIPSTRLLHIPKSDRTKENLLSARWHCDNGPKDLIHMAVFLHDVTEAHGPTFLQTRQRTRQLMRMGFYTRHDYAVALEEMEDKTYVKQLTGKIGTAHLMLPNVCLHRAGIPEAGYIRDSLFFSFRPGLEPKQVKSLAPLQSRIYQMMEKISEDAVNPISPTYEGRDIVYS